MALTRVTYSMIEGAQANVLDYGAVGDGVANDTAAIQAAIDAVFAAGGGTIYFPQGTYLVGGLSRAWGSAVTSIRFQGAGQNATNIQKTGASLDPVFTLSASASDGTYSEFCDLRIIGTSLVNGITMTNLARNVFRNVRIQGCDIAVNNEGSHINAFYDCNLLSNAVGYKARKANSIFCNLVLFYGGSVRGNTSWGFDIGDTSGFHSYGTDIESNGTASNTATGALITRSTCDDEMGYSNISFDGVWFEGNLGTNILLEACAGLNISFKDTPMINSEVGRVIVDNGVGQLTVDRVTAGSSGDTVSTAATQFILRESTINLLTNNATVSTIEGWTNNGPFVQFRQTNGTGTFAVRGDAVRSKSGSVSTTTGVAATLFTPSDGAGLYEVYAYLSLGGAAYMSAATVAYDGSTVVRLSGTNGANLTITVSGADVQATQTSGVNQNISYVYLKIGA